MGHLINSCYDILSMPLRIEGYTFSLWAVMIFSIVGFLLLYFVFRLFR